MFDLKREKIYKHTHLSPAESDRLKPLMESAFGDQFKVYGGAENAQRSEIKKERLQFVSDQFANRMRIARTMNLNPLYEDAAIFGETMPQLKNLFESVSVPGNIIGMGNVANPMTSSTMNGGIWNADYKGGSGDVPSYVFGLQSHIALHCIGFDLMPTIAVDTPKVLITFIDTVYGGGTFDDVDNLPSFVELSSSVFTYSWIKTKTLVRATTEVVFVADDGKCLKTRFIVGSTVKAAMTVEILATGTSAENTGTITYTWDNSITVKAVVDAVNAATGAKVYTATYTTANTGVAIEKLGLDYASAIRTNIAEAASNNNSLGGMTRAQHEKGPKHKLNVIAMDKQLEMVGLEIEADTSNIQIKDMAAMGVNVIAHLYTGVQNQLVQSLDEVILRHLYRMGVTHAVNAFESQSLNYSLYISAPANTTKDMDTVDVTFENMLGEDCRTKMGNLDNVLVSSSYENQMTHGERLYSRILLITEFGGNQNRIAPYDFLVASGTLCSALKKQSTFATCPVTTTFSNSPELHYTGTIFGNVSVYKNPKIRFDDPRILFGRRGNDTDPGSKFLAYDLAASRQMVVEGTMAEKIRVWSRFQIADVGFYPELNYYTAVMINDFKWA